MKMKLPTLLAVAAVAGCMSTQPRPMPPPPANGMTMRCRVVFVVDSNYAIWDGWLVSTGEFPLMVKNDGVNAVLLRPYAEASPRYLDAIKMRDALLASGVAYVSIGEGLPPTHLNTPIRLSR